MNFCTRAKRGLGVHMSANACRTVAMLVRLRYVQGWDASGFSSLNLSSSLLSASWWVLRCGDTGRPAGKIKVKNAITRRSFFASTSWLTARVSQFGI